MKKTLFPLLICVASAGFAWVSYAQETEETPRADAFAPIGKAISEGNLHEARALLQTMRADGLRGDQFSRWENLAARVAIRLGDQKWLEELNKGAELSTGADELVVLAAMRLMFANRLADAQELLDGIKAPMKMQEIPRRRYEQLQMKSAQLRGDAKSEEKWAKTLVEFVGQWDSQTCQSCHANPKAHGKETTSFDAPNWWVGARYVELLRESKMAPQVVREAREQLEKDPKNNGARMKLAYALRASGDENGALQTWREIDWVHLEGREWKKPLRFGVFP